MKQVLQDYLNHIRLGETQRYRNMALFPLLCDKESKADYLLLDEALEKDLIVITEVDENGEVPELKVEKILKPARILINNATRRRESYETHNNCLCNFFRNTSFIR